MTDIVERLKIEAANQREIASEWSGEKRDLHIENATRSEEAASEIERLRRPFRNADKRDWDLLFRMLPDSGYGRFWKAVLIEMKHALDASLGGVR